MDLTFQGNELRRLCCARKAMEAMWGVEKARRVGQLLQELEAMATLGDLEVLTHLRHEVHRAGGELVVRDRRGIGIRIAVQTNGRATDGPIVWKECGEAIIVEVTV